VLGRSDASCRKRDGDLAQCEEVRGGDGKCCYRSIDGGVYLNSPGLVVLQQFASTNCSNRHPFFSSMVTDSSGKKLPLSIDFSTYKTPRVKLGDSVDVTTVMLGTGYNVLEETAPWSKLGIAATFLVAGTLIGICAGAIRSFCGGEVPRLGVSFLLQSQPHISSCPHS